MSDTLREKIANEIGDSLGWPKDRRSSFVKIAERVMALREIADGQAALEREKAAKAQSDEYHRLGLQWRNPAPNAAPTIVGQTSHTLKVR